MNVLAILGSPRRSGNTAKLLNQFLTGVGENDTINVENIFIQEKHIEFCRRCEKCKESGSGCIINDDMREIYPKVKNADILVFATPIYCFSMSAQLKTFIDRLYAVNENVYINNFRGKKIVLLMTYEGDMMNNIGPELVKKTFINMCDNLFMDIVDICVVSNNEIRSNLSNKAISTQKAYLIGKKLVGVGV